MKIVVKKRHRTYSCILKTCPRCEVRNKQKFSPISVSIVLETDEEARNFLRLVAHSADPLFLRGIEKSNFRSLVLDDEMEGATGEAGNRV